MEFNSGFKGLNLQRKLCDSPLPYCMIYNRNNPQQ